MRVVKSNIQHQKCTGRDKNTRMQIHLFVCQQHIEDFSPFLITVVRVEEAVQNMYQINRTILSLFPMGMTTLRRNYWIPICG